MTPCDQLLDWQVRDVLSRYRTTEFNLTGVSGVVPSGTIDLSSAPDSVLSQTQLSQTQFCHAFSWGSLCALCDDGYDTKVKGVCAKCETTLWGVAKFVLLQAAMTIFLHWKGGQIDVRSDGGKLSILIFFFQALMQLSDRSGPYALFGLRGLLDNFLSMEVSQGARSASVHRNLLVCCRSLN